MSDRFKKCHIQKIIHDHARKEYKTRHFLIKLVYNNHMQISISYPSSFKCLLKQGQNVDFNTPYLEKKISVDVSIPIAKKLGVNPTHIFRYLKKLVGEKLTKEKS